jgi:hypothetical protein
MISYHIKDNIVYIWYHIYSIIYMYHIIIYIYIYIYNHTMSNQTWLPNKSAEFKQPIGSNCGIPDLPVDDHSWARKDTLRDNLPTVFVWNILWLKIHSASQIIEKAAIWLNHYNLRPDIWGNSLFYKSLTSRLTSGWGPYNSRIRIYNMYVQWNPIVTITIYLYQFAWFAWHMCFSSRKCRRYKLGTQENLSTDIKPILVS